MADFIERPRHLCPLGGAMAAISALPGAVPILHAAPGCAGNAVWTQNGACGLQVGGYVSGLSAPSTNVQEREVVFGGTDRLREEIRHTLRVIDGKLFFVITGCVTEIIGDDVGAVVGEFRDEGVEILHAETGGFHGNSYWGYDLVLQRLFRAFVEPAAEKVPRHVNLWGVPPFLDPFWRGNLDGVRQLLEKLGLTVQSFFTARDTLEGIRGAASAELNVVVSDAYGVEAARTFEEVHGTPFVTLPLPIGPAAADAFVRAVGEALGLPGEAVERVVEEENRRYYWHLEALTDCVNDMDLQRYAVVVGDANYAPALTKFLADDLGWLPEVAVVTDTLRDGPREAVEGRFAGFESGVEPSLVFETDTSEILGHVSRRWPPPEGQAAPAPPGLPVTDASARPKYYHALSPAFVIGSSLDRELATALGAAHLSVSFPVANRAVLDRGYTGYRGGLRLTEDLLSAIVAGR